jgi:death-on-curing family protein
MNKKIEKQQNIVIYKDSKGNVELKSDVENETVWASQAQIAELFKTERSVITKHVNNIFKAKELDKNSVCAFFAHTAKDGKIYQTQYYNLDLILSVGYRVNSVQATKFRQWATKTLREYIIKGVAINEDRIKKLHEKGITDLGKKIEFIQRTIQKRKLDSVEVDGLLSVIKDYANSWELLQKYDEGGLVTQKSAQKEIKRFDYDYVRPRIEGLKTDLMKKAQATDLFANERDHTFQGILKTIYQTFSGKELYTSLEEKAAHLLYFVIKDHPFSDGNKRTGAFLFVLFLRDNNILMRKNGEKKISDMALVALALLIAESDPNDKENMIALVTNLIA